MARMTAGPGFDDTAAESDFVVLALLRREVESAKNVLRGAKGRIEIGADGSRDRCP